MIQLGIILALVTSLLGAGVYVVNSIKDQGRAECKAEHQEAARMAEMRARERSTQAAQRFEADRAKSQQRSREIVESVSRSASDSACLSPDSLRVLNDHLREARGSGEPIQAVPGSAGHTGQKREISGSVDR